MRLSYLDKDQNEMIFSSTGEAVVPVIGDEYIHISIMLPCESQMVYGTGKACKHDHDGNLIGC